MRGVEALGYYMIRGERELVAMSMVLGRDAMEKLIDNFGGMELKIPTRQEYEEGIKRAVTGLDRLRESEL